jgi:hypothetical protein
VISFFSFAAHTYAQPSEKQPAAIRFAMAHDHKLSWCYGYLYIDNDTVSYVVDHPSKFKRHEFKVKRSEFLTVGRWRVLGQPLKVLELKFGKTVYHLWWLTDEREVQNGPEQRSQPLDAAAPDTIITAIKDPASVEKANATATDTKPSSTATPGDLSTTTPMVGGHIGVVLINSSPTEFPRTNSVLVKQLEPDGPAAQAGLRVNDVITAINGRAVSNSADVSATVVRLAPGSTAQLQILRAGQPVTIKVFVALGASPAIQPATSAPSTPAASMLSSSPQNSATQTTLPHPAVTGDSSSGLAGLGDTASSTQQTDAEAKRAELARKLKAQAELASKVAEALRNSNGPSQTGSSQPIASTEVSSMPGQQGTALVNSATVPSSATLAGDDAWRPDSQIGDLQFNVPDGWKQVQTPNGNRRSPV